MSSAANTQVIIAATDIVFAARTLRALMDGGSLLPMDRVLVAMAVAAPERCEVVPNEVVNTANFADLNIKRSGEPGVVPASDR